MKRLKLLSLLLIVALLSSLSINAATATLLVGQSYQTEISTSGYHYLSIESVSSTNPSVSVSKMGLVVKATVNSYFSGEATVTINLRYQLYAGQSYQYRSQEFSLSCNDTHIAVSPANLSIKPGESYQLSYGFDRPTYVTPSLQWTSSDEAIATVSQNGLVVGKGEGNATIYLRSNLGSNTSECRVKVSGQSGSGGVQDSGVADISWFNKNESEFEISTFSQLLGFRNLVNQGEHFKDKTIRLSNDIDLSSYNWTTPISIYPNVFEGTFDGCGNSLTIYVNKVETGTQDEFCFGFFGNSWGRIKNLTMKGDVTVEIAGMTTYASVGVLCGWSSYLESCINEASLTYVRSYVKSAGNSDYVGGFAGKCSKPVTNCINRGKILTRTKYSTSANTNNYYIGGIVGYSNDVTGCANYGTIKNETSGDSNYGMLREYIGGMLGWCVSDDLVRCSNFGNICGTSKFSGIGGLVGGSGGSIKITDSYVGKCTIANTQGGSACYVNSICGSLRYSNETFTNNYSASDISYSNKNGGYEGSTLYNSSQMQTDEFAGVLGHGSWIGAEGLYPIVKGSPDEYKYYISTITDITCYTATVSANIWDILASNVKSWGLLLTKDDGKESYIPGNLYDYKINLTGLSPNRSYRVRWFAQDNEGKEYYGVYATFETKTLIPYTSDIDVIGVSTAILKGESYLGTGIRAGFFIQRNDGIDNGNYFWGAHFTDESNFALEIDDLIGNTTYNYAAVIEYEGVVYAGETKLFDTKLLKTTYPSDFTTNTVQLNGEVSSDLSDIYFEFRACSIPSVIESDKISATVDNNRAFAKSPLLSMEETYRYRLVALNGDETVFGEWIEFKFKGEAGLVNVLTDISLEDEIKVFSIKGQLIFEGYMQDFTPAQGVYIICYRNKSIKIKY